MFAHLDASTMSICPVIEQVNAVSQMSRKNTTIFVLLDTLCHTTCIYALPKLIIIMIQNSANFQQFEKLLCINCANRHRMCVTGILNICLQNWKRLEHIII